MAEEKVSELLAAMDAALSFVQGKLIAMNREKGLVGVWCDAFRVGWESARRTPTPVPLAYVSEAVMELVRKKPDDYHYAMMRGKPGDKGLVVPVFAASPSPPKADGPREVIESRWEEAGFIEFLNEDVPVIVRELDAPAAILVDMNTRRIVGYRVYDPAAKPKEA